MKAVFVYYAVFLVAFYLFSMMFGVGKTEFTVMFLVALVICINWSIEKRYGGIQ